MRNPRSSGRSKAATVGLNQSICWAAIYGTSIVAAAWGGWIADHVAIQYLLFGLAAVPLVVFWVVLRLPRDTARSIPLKDSVVNFWNGINTGPIVWIILFYFLFHFQPAMGALWTNYLIESLHFTQTQIGYAEGVSYVGVFLGVLLFVWLGIKLQDRYGLKSVFRIFILLSIALNLTQYLLVDPYFSRIAGGIGSLMPGIEIGTVRLGYYAAYSFLLAIVCLVHPDEHLQPGRRRHPDQRGGVPVCRFHVGREPGVLILVRERFLVVRERPGLRDLPVPRELSVRHSQCPRRQDVDQPAHLYRVDGLLDELLIGTYATGRSEDAGRLG